MKKFIPNKLLINHNPFKSFKLIINPHSFRSYSDSSPSKLSNDTNNPTHSNNLNNLNNNLNISIDQLNATLNDCYNYGNIKNLIKNHQELLKTMENPSINYNDLIPLQKELSRLTLIIDPFENLSGKLNDFKELYELALLDNDINLLDELNQDIESSLKEANQLKLKLIMSNELDLSDCLLEIRAGSGGTESCDWTSILSKMYIQWSKTHNLSPQIIDHTSDEIAGYKSITILLKGNYAFGYLKYETGVHRLVRVSPFDSNSRRHTSFASVQTLPFTNTKSISSAKEIEINPLDLKIETCRAGGAGGQHVNKTESAIKITHIPTGITVRCQDQRSQHQNKSMALQILKLKLFEKELRQLSQDKAKARNELPENAWGSQIRSYVLHPYRLIKDSRTGFESTQCDEVLNGIGLNEFLEKSLIHFNSKNVL